MTPTTYLCATPTVEFYVLIYGRLSSPIQNTCSGGMLPERLEQGTHSVTPKIHHLPQASNNTELQILDILHQFKVQSASS